MYEQSDAFEICSTYPRSLVVPASVDDDLIRHTASFRSRGRLPCIVWKHPVNGAVVCRSAQPLVGLNSKRSPADEAYLQAIAAAGGTSRALHILDARSQLAATANRALGKGTEILANYPGVRLTFMGIDNIHALRDALRKLTALCLPDAVGDADNNYLSKLEASGWLKQVRLLCQSSVRMAELVDVEAVSVLNHCSDGWDRTSQVRARINSCHAARS